MVPLTGAAPSIKPTNGIGAVIRLLREGRGIKADAEFEHALIARSVSSGRADIRPEPRSRRGPPRVAHCES
jgi:hypothetical protein